MLKKGSSRDQIINEGEWEGWWEETLTQTTNTTIFSPLKKIERVIGDQNRAFPGHHAKVHGYWAVTLTFSETRGACFKLTIWNGSLARAVQT